MIWLIEASLCISHFDVAAMLFSADLWDLRFPDIVFKVNCVLLLVIVDIFVLQRVPTKQSGSIEFSYLYMNIEMKYRFISPTFRMYT